MSWPPTSGTATVGAATVVVCCVVVAVAVAVVSVSTLPLETRIVTTPSTGGACEATTPSGRFAGSRIARTE